MFNIGDKVIMTLDNNKVGIITGTDKNCFVVKVETEEYPYIYPEEHLQPYIEEKTLPEKILLVEDGSVDVEKLERDGFYVISYRQGAKPPMWLTHQHKFKGDEVV